MPYGYDIEVPAGQLRHREIQRDASETLGFGSTKSVQHG